MPRFYFFLNLVFTANCSKLLVFPGMTYSVIHTVTYCAFLLLNACAKVGAERKIKPAYPKKTGSREDFSTKKEFAACPGV